MGDPVTTALIVSTGLATATAVTSAQQQSEAMKLQAKQAENQATAQITERTRALTEALATQNSMLGASGRTVDSIESVLKGQEKRYQSDVEMIKAGASAQSAQYESAGKSAQSLGYLNAGTSLAQGYANYKYSMLGTNAPTRGSVPTRG